MQRESNVQKTVENSTEAAKNTEFLKKEAEWRELYEKKSKEFEKELEKRKEKKYIIKGNEEFFNNLMLFIENEAQWSFHESIGVLELKKQFDKQMGDYKKGKTKSFCLDSVGLEACYYFLSKVKGKGYEEAKRFQELLRPIAEAMTLSKTDSEKIDALRKDLATIEEGLKTGALGASIDENPYASTIEEISKEK
jgi:hypothetical protein